MALTVYDVEIIALQDGTEVTLKPLPIGKLRRFMKAWAKMATIKEEVEVFDTYINCCGIALVNDFNERFDKLLDEEMFITPEYREYLEDVLDMQTIFKILEVTGGLKLNDPKLEETLQAAQVGTN